MKLLNQYQQWIIKTKTMNQKNPTKRRVLHLSEETESVVYNPKTKELTFANFRNLSSDQIQSIIDFLTDVKTIMK